MTLHAEQRHVLMLLANARRQRRHATFAWDASLPTIAGLFSDGLATTPREHVMAGHKAEAGRVRITETGRNALAVECYKMPAVQVGAGSDRDEGGYPAEFVISDCVGMV